MQQQLNEQMQKMKVPWKMGRALADKTQGSKPRSKPGDKLGSRAREEE